MVETATTVEYTAAELRVVIDAAARARVGVSGDELLSRHAAGRIEPDWDVSDLLILADLIDGPPANAG
ncbi:MAG TPA: hypothetical protein VGW75_03710 [Solirubrobacteraceae bacterium]|jgi:hypothetical protein|nr:hypothetical protein [Solirubrobacteraceae bacterium]